MTDMEQCLDLARQVVLELELMLIVAVMRAEE